MDEDERLNFNSFVDAYNAYQNPNLAPVAPAFGGYGYQAPTMDMMLAPQQMPQMMLDPTAIYDPTVGAAMQVLNRPMMIRQTPGLLGDGTDYQRQFGLLQDIAPTRMQQYERIAAPPPPPPPPVYSDGGDGGSSGNYGNYDSFDRGDGDLYTYNEQYDAQGGGSRAPDWVGLPADMMHRNFMGDIFGYQDPAPVYNMNTGTTDYANIGDPNAGMGGAYEGSAGSTAATADMPDGPDGANAPSGGCVIATHAVASGAFTPREKRQAEAWCIKKLHNKWWGEAIRRGYRYYGKAAIENGKASTHYQEFKDFVDFGSGKRRNAKTAFTFAWRSVQFFFTGLLVKS